MKKHDFLEILSYNLFTADVDDIGIDSGCVINALNQYSFVMAEKDAKFKQALHESDVLIPDGIGIVAAARLLKGARIKKIAGADIHSHLLKKLNEINGNCFYLGSSYETLINIKKRLAKEYPAINMRFYSPPFKAKFTEEDNLIMVNEINEFKPDVLFIGMTAPKQEKWSFENKGKLNVKIICSIGAVFDFYGGNVKRPGEFWIKMGLEWFIRLLNEPIHLWKRYIYYGPVFVYRIINEKIKISRQRTK